MDPVQSVSAAAIAVATSGTAKVLAQGAVDGAGALLSRLCLPAAEEAGQIAADYLRGFRKVNLAMIEAKAKAKIEAMEKKLGKPLKLPLSIGIEVMDSGSKVSDETLQDMWAGLLASSCSDAGDDDSNLQFVHMVAKFSPQQARLFRWIYANCEVVKDNSGVVQGNCLNCIRSEIMSATSIREPAVLDAAIAGLASAGLIHSGPFLSLSACLGLSPLGVLASLRVRGIRSDPATHFGPLKIVDLLGEHTPPPRWG